MKSDLSQFQLYIALRLSCAKVTGRKPQLRMKCCQQERHDDHRNTIESDQQPLHRRERPIEPAIQLGNAPAGANEKAQGCGSCGCGAMRSATTVHCSLSFVPLTEHIPAFSIRGNGPVHGPIKQDQHQAKYCRAEDLRGEACNHEVHPNWKLSKYC